ncbi:MAG: hypothetical protein KatS3mg111_0624 [Pirellulaceae bacterium]|nr:MAG: hypothetical protein KatS3mg111_0624 [Pirellulaceae bacterium]
MERFASVPPSYRLLPLAGNKTRHWREKKKRSESASRLSDPSTARLTKPGMTIPPKNHQTIPPPHPPPVRLTTTHPPPGRVASNASGEGPSGEGPSGEGTSGEGPSGEGLPYRARGSDQPSCPRSRFSTCLTLVNTDNATLLSHGTVVPDPLSTALAQSPGASHLPIPGPVDRVPAGRALRRRSSIPVKPCGPTSRLGMSSRCGR